MDNENPPPVTADFYFLVRKFLSGGPLKETLKMTNWLNFNYSQNVLTGLGRIMNKQSNIWYVNIFTLGLIIYYSYVVVLGLLTLLPKLCESEDDGDDDDEDVDEKKRKKEKKQARVSASQKPPVKETIKVNHQLVDTYDFIDTEVDVEILPSSSRMLRSVPKKRIESDEKAKFYTSVSSRGRVRKLNPRVIAFLKK